MSHVIYLAVPLDELTVLIRYNDERALTANGYSEHFIYESRRDELIAKRNDAVAQRDDEGVV